MTHPTRVLVVGAGAAGLATARALLRHGIEPDVVERNATWSHPGAGMYLPANAVRALGVLGLERALLDRAREITRQRFLDHRGRMLLDVDLHGFWGATGPCLSISRRNLHEVLRDQVAVRLNTTLAALEQDGSVVHAVFADGSTEDYDLVVGADGVHSWVRHHVFGSDPPPFVGQASWRFVVEGFPEVTAWTVRLGREKAFLTVPLPDGRVYCYADVTASGSDDPTDGDSARLAEWFGEFVEPVPRILEDGTRSGAPPYFSPIEEVVHEPWVHDRVVLVGDAAHAMSPNMAEGAGMALEDAYVLAETVAAGKPLAEFEARRRPRVEWVQTQTHRRDRTRGLPTLVRNTTLRIAGGRIFRGNYKPLLSEP